MRLITGKRVRRLYDALLRLPVGLSIAGVNNTPPVWAVFSPSGNVTCTAGTEVTCVTTTNPLTATAGQGYFPVILGCMSFLMGGTASASLVIAARYHSGSDFSQTQTVATGILVNSATISVPIMIVGAAAICNVSGQINAAALEVAATAGTTACTCLAASTFLSIGLVAGGI